MDTAKVQAVLHWPTRKTIRAVRGFLGLAGYYHRFIQGYGAIAAPLTKLLKKEGFRWDPEADAAFWALQEHSRPRWSSNYQNSPSHSWSTAMLRALVWARCCIKALG